MSKKLNRKFAISRRAGCSLWGDNKDPYNKKNYPPGMHGIRGYRKKTEFGNQLLAKQKLRMYYGNIRESQFKKIFLHAKKVKGNTGENFVTLLESRLDAFVYRCNFAPTIFCARQFVSHKHILVNKKVVNIASYTLKINDKVEFNNKSQKLNYTVKVKNNNNKKIPDYISIKDNSEATYIKLPKMSDIPYPTKLEPNYVVEFYSR